MAALIISAGLLYGLCQFGQVHPRKGFWRDHELFDQIEEANKQKLEHEHCGIEPTLTYKEIFDIPDTSGDDPIARRKAEKELLPEWALRQLAKWRKERGQDEYGLPLEPYPGTE